jgi:hypothetical protein
VIEFIIAKIDVESALLLKGKVLPVNGDSKRGRSGRNYAFSWLFLCHFERKALPRSHVSGPRFVKSSPPISFVFYSLSMSKE